MAEARAEEDEERLRESGGARRSSLCISRFSSQGPLSSIRAVIKRTSARTSSQSDHQRDRSRRPEITILSAEPLPSNTWFPGASGAFPPAPPPAPPTWAAGSATVQLPPPSYEQVIREKSREQNLHSSSSSSPSPSSRHSTSTIATQTDTNSPGPQSSAARPVRRHSKPPRPSLPLKHMPEALREQCGVQTDFDDIIDDISPIGPAPTATTSTQINLDSPGDPMKEEPSVRPRPRPRSRVALRPNEDVLDQPMTREVKVQTLVRLKDDGAENVFAGFDDAPSNISSKYLQDLLEVFGSDETHVQHRESQQSDAKPFNRPQPRPRTQKSKPQLAPKPSVFEVFDTREPTVEQNPSKPLSPPVPAPRPLLNKLQSPSESRSSSVKPSPSACPDSTPPRQQMAAVASTPSERRNSDDQTTNTPVKTPPVIVTDRNVGKRPSVPKHSRPPPPVLRKTPSTSQATVDVFRAPDASIPSLPPRYCSVFPPKSGVCLVFFPSLILSLCVSDPVAANSSHSALLQSKWPNFQAPPPPLL
uniref:Pollen-specific leucine-rich repeat extensin-like protein 1 n=1 Tax=Sinocyclocheilus rhinocerous TaxID=307959 RepID=A0A673LRP3_9TELE